MGGGEDGREDWAVDEVHTAEVVERRLHRTRLYVRAGTLEREMRESGMSAADQAHVLVVALVKCLMRRRPQRSAVRRMMVSTFARMFEAAWLFEIVVMKSQGE